MAPLNTAPSSWPERRQAALSYCRSWYFIGSLVILAAVFAFMKGFKLDLQWFWLLLFALFTIPLSPWIKDPVRFFRGGLNDDSQGTSSWLLLSSSTFVSWVFAKSILNASTLGAKYGIVGGLAYGKRGSTGLQQSWITLSNQHEAQAVCHGRLQYVDM